MGLEEAHVRLMHQLNVETLGLPAIAVGAEVEVPLGPEDHAPVWSAMVAATRTWRGTRAHVNARLTSTPAPSGDGDAASPWELGVAIDRTLPLHHLLLGAEVGAVRRAGDVDATDWYTGVGLRWQWTMRTSLDAGVERTFATDRAWSMSFGVTTSFGIRSFTRGYR